MRAHSVPARIVQPDFLSAQAHVRPKLLEERPGVASMSDGVEFEQAWHVAWRGISLLVVVSWQHKHGVGEPSTVCPNQGSHSP
eukprot:CAMPEP_0171938438 /NCGR_PEP_ID=MMETSP0993-20121228/35471_1 /TAXON_ID=483369 /ORGANISM="non described non described, Strain CCMP2098" /LENGTH=82 /DNA_ID=CAMNT_0012580017 /DNA_START=141 /DNA_END=386 /DNA_ORIENTATION=+